MLPLAPFRLPRALEQVSPAQWKATVDAWRFIVRSYLALSSEEFKAQLQIAKELPNFLVSYLQELGSGKDQAGRYPLDTKLHHDCYSLIHRAWSSDNVPAPILSPGFLKHFSLVYGSIPGSPTTLEQVWREQDLASSAKMLQDKASLQTQLEKGPPSASVAESLSRSLLEARCLVKACAGYGKFLLVGADFLDALMEAWGRGDAEMQRKITLVTYAALLSLSHGQPKHYSTLADHLYTLRMAQETGAPKPSLLAELITKTPFLHKYRRIAEEAGSGRITDMLPVFEKMGKPPRRKMQMSKGKQPVMGFATDASIQESVEISQIHELFPELGLGYIARLLDEYDRNTETVTARLLDQSLPSYLQEANQHESLDTYILQRQHQPEVNGPTEPRRHNAYDDDDLDQLNVSASKLHIGKKVEDVLSEPINKTAFYSALAALDSDDDERDDTYDAEDVGGTIDIEKPEYDQRDANDSGGLSEEAEAFLFKRWSLEPDLFSRKPTTRHGKSRIEVREKTGLSDEQIEGWATMLQREPRRLRKLHEKFPPEYYDRANAEQDGGEDTENHSSPENNDHGGHAGGQGRGRGRGSGRARGSGRGHAGRGRGDVAGPANEQSTRRARQNKDANKASRGNHNRRNERDKKMARVGL